MSLYISINTASSTLAKSPIDDAITFMAAHAAIEKKNGRIPDGPSLDVTFLFPGEHEAIPFEGMKMGGYTTESDTLFFETAVPGHILRSDSAPEYVAVVMQEVVENAQEFFIKNEIYFNAQDWKRTMSNLTVSPTAVSLTH